METLRAPGGCPWDHEQDHATLAQYVLEEAYEVVEAIEEADRAALREELGDLLLQVVFHASIARQEPEPFDLDDVACGVADKLVRRHPHVFANTGHGAPGAMSAAESHVKWDRIKAAEKSRTSVLDGIPKAQPALARVQKMVARARRGGLDTARLAELVETELVAADGGLGVREGAIGGEAGAGIGLELLAQVLEAESRGVDAEGALRGIARLLEQAIRREENPS
jgi:XTP/dITP diphosphohydrolase